VQNRARNQPSKLRLKLCLLLPHVFFKFLALKTLPLRGDKSFFWEPTHGSTLRVERQAGSGTLKAFRCDACIKKAFSWRGYRAISFRTHLQQKHRHRETLTSGYNLNMRARDAPARWFRTAEELLKRSQARGVSRKTLLPGKDIFTTPRGKTR